MKFLAVAMVCFLVAVTVARFFGGAVALVESGLR